jgi:hypothetical protein
MGLAGRKGRAATGTLQPTAMPHVFAKALLRGRIYCASFTRRLGVHPGCTRGYQGFLFVQEPCKFAPIQPVQLEVLLLAKTSPATCRQWGIMASKQRNIRKRRALDDEEEAAGEGEEPVLSVEDTKLLQKQRQRKTVSWAVRNHN